MSGRRPPGDTLPLPLPGRTQDSGRAARAHNSPHWQRQTPPLPPAAPPRGARRAQTASTAPPWPRELRWGPTPTRAQTHDTAYSSRAAGRWPPRAPVCAAPRHAPHPPRVRRQGPPGGLPAHGTSERCARLQARRGPLPTHAPAAHTRGMLRRHLGGAPCITACTPIGVTGTRYESGVTGCVEDVQGLRKPCSPRQDTFSSSDSLHRTFNPFYSRRRPFFTDTARRSRCSRPTTRRGCSRPGATLRSRMGPMQVTVVGGDMLRAGCWGRPARSLGAARP